MATTITADSLLPRPKLDCNRGYDVAVKGASVVVYQNQMWTLTLVLEMDLLEQRLRCQWEKSFLTSHVSCIPVATYISQLTKF